ncbi:Protein T2 [Clydaea vesicula]|uniref:Protein T2 n=1 Tax=Clydaea vesicula TaxID=447962 RepID=A0AAD5U307_9FUNG|nr:Protein T2 [Clydaea vesicula]
MSSDNVNEKNYTTQTVISQLYSLQNSTFPENLNPPFLKSPLYSTDAMVLLCPHLIDSISGSLPPDSVVVTVTKEEARLERKTEEEEALAREKTSSICNNLEKDKRGHIVSELYKTEKNYVRDLDIIMNIFDGMDELFELHTLFVSKLEDLLAVDKWSTEKTAIGKLFSDLRESFDRSYAVFIDSYNLSQKEMKGLESDNPAYKSFISELSKLKEANRQNLKELLITPIQRTTRYHLFLKDLEKHTPDDHPDKRDLSEAWASMTSLAKLVNDKKRSEEERTGLFEAFEQTKNCPATLISAKRRMIFSVDVLDIKSSKSFHLFLCSDLLLITSNINVSRITGLIGKGNEDKLYKYVSQPSLLNIHIEDAPDNAIKIVANGPGLTESSSNLDAIPGQVLYTFKFEGYEALKNKKNFILTFESSVKSCMEGK